MPKLVYLPQINATTFLLFTFREGGFRLRDYSRRPRPVVVMKQGGGRTAGTIEAMTHQSGNQSFDEPEWDVEDFNHWNARIVDVNRRYLPRSNGGLIATKSWTREIIVGVIVAVLGATVVAWLGLGK
jgi:hypothetical protein